MMKSKMNVIAKVLLIVVCYLTIPACASSPKQSSVPVANSSKTESSKMPIKSDSKSSAVKASASSTASPAIAQMTQKDGSIHIQYIGNSCFSILFADGTILVTDPYGRLLASSFAPFPELKANVITTACGFGDHQDGKSEVDGSPKIIQYTEVNKPIKVGDVEITGYAAKHCANLGDEAIFVYKEGKYKIVNMGEADKIDSTKLKAAIKDADVILTYAGEYGEVKNKELFQTVGKTNVKVMIPEHYSMDPKFLYYKQPTIDTILTELPQGMKVNKASELVLQNDMEKQFLVLSPIGGTK